jgi:hypothetical protein
VTPMVRSPQEAALELRRVVIELHDAEYTAMSSKRSEKPGSKRSEKPGSVDPGFSRSISDLTNERP